MFVVLVLPTIAIYSRTLFNQFLRWDDTLHLIPTGEVEHMGLNGFLALFLHPADIPLTYAIWQTLTNIFLPAGGAFGDIVDRAWAFHGLNIVVHIANVLLVYLLVKHLVRSDKAAVFGAALFAFHPLQCEAVSWVSGLKDLLSTALVLGALLMHLRATTAAPSTRLRGRLLKAGALGAFLLACMSKQTAAVAPLLLAAVYLFYYRRSVENVLVNLAPWFMIATAMAVLTKATQPDFVIDESVGVPLRPLVFADAVAFYLWKLVLPLRLAPDYGRTPLHILHTGLIWATWLAPAIVRHRHFHHTRHSTAIRHSRVVAVHCCPGSCFRADSLRFPRPFDGRRPVCVPRNAGTVPPLWSCGCAGTKASMELGYRPSACGPGRTHHAANGPLEKHRRPFRPQPDGHAIKRAFAPEARSHCSGRW